MDRVTRAASLAAEAERIVALLRERGATLVVAFGSFARGDVGRASDLDLIVLIESNLPFMKRLGLLYEDLAPRVGLDLLAYTPAEWKEIRLRPFFRRALAEGKVLHAP